MNSVYLSGNLTRDPEVRYLDTGKSVTNFTIAVNERGRDGKEYVSFIRCSSWDEAGIRLADQASRGTRVILEGRISQKKWTDKDGKVRDDVSVVVHTAYVVQKPATAMAESTPPDQIVGDDLPF